ncbi:MAG: ATP-binding protein [Candidatus Riflebacteria bacterium]|nr:ATP-binding protein [Candidatus Riflebacteria bacterium]
MIRKFGGKNCWSFKEWCEIDFCINKNVPKEYGFNDVGVVPALLFEGANASGKTCALRILSFIASFCSDSFELKPESDIFFDTYFNNQDKSEFFVDFSLADDIKSIYSYELTIDRKKIYSEKLIKNKKIVFLRKDNQVKKDLIFNFPQKLINLRSNVSFISTLMQYNITSIKPFYDFFINIISNVKYIGIENYQEVDSVARYYYMLPDVLRKVVEKIKLFDTGIEDIEIKQAVTEEGKNTFISIFKHKTEDGTKNLEIFYQSMGTKILYKRLLDFYAAIERGGVLILDELDCHLHSSILPELLAYFLDPNININHSQIIFTAHNSSLLDFMKKYRTYLFAKENGESFCYRIDELPNNIDLRNDRPLEPLYKAGLLGGIPRV